MHFSSVVPAICLAFASVGYTQDVDSDDIPSQCRSVCDPIVSLTERCDREDNGDGERRLNCVCTGPNASSQIPLCAACYAQYDRNDGNDNDVYDIVTSCSFSSTTYAPSTATGSSSASSTPPTTGSSSASSGAPTATRSTIVVTTTNAAGSTSTATAEVVTSAPTSASASPSQTENAAVRGVVGGLGLVAGVAGLAGGLL